MIKTYIIPQLNAIRIDSEISLRLSSDPESLVYEPGSGTAGAGGGDSNGNGNGNESSNWERTGFGSSGFNNTDIWK